MNRTGRENFLISRSSSRLGCPTILHLPPFSPPPFASSGITNPRPPSFAPPHTTALLFSSPRFERTNEYEDMRRTDKLQKREKWKKCVCFFLKNALYVCVIASRSEQKEDAGYVRGGCVSSWLRSFELSASPYRYSLLSQCMRPNSCVSLLISVIDACTERRLSPR